jgi:hypothetical protein
MAIKRVQAIGRWDERAQSLPAPAVAAVVADLAQAEASVVTPQRLARPSPCSGATPNACSAALLRSMAHMQAVSLAAASLSGAQQAAGGADVELRYAAQGTSFAAHDGTAPPAPEPEPEPAVPACAEAAATQATARAAARRRARRPRPCIVPCACRCASESGSSDGASE